MNEPKSSAEFLTGAGEITQDWGELARHLATNGWELTTDPAPRQFSSGLGNLNYLIELDATPMVLRRPPMGPIPPGANDMGRESRILMRLWKKFPLAPRAHHFCDDAAVIGAPFFIMEYRPGLVIGGTMPPQMAPDAGAGLGQMMAEQLAAFHGVDPAAVDLDTLGNPAGFAARTLKGWTKRAQAAWGGAAPATLEMLAEWLGLRVPEDGAVTWLHNDFKLDNLILDPTTLAPIALIDWDMGTRGDPLWDLGVLLSYWTEAGDPQAVIDMNQMPTTGHGFPTREQAAAIYAELTGRDLSGFRYRRVLAMVRTACVFRQLYRRFTSGGTDDPRYEPFGHVANGILEFGVDVAHGRCF